MPDIITNTIQSFNPEEVFASVQGFLGSGYIFIAVAGLIAYSVIKKLLKLVVAGAVAGLVWFACSSGMADPIFSALGLG